MTQLYGWVSSALTQEEAPDGPGQAPELGTFCLNLVFLLFLGSYLLERNSPQGRDLPLGAPVLLPPGTQHGTQGKQIHAG